MAEFVSRFLVVQREHGWRPLPPVALVDAWEQFIADVEAGYSWDISEYWNDLRVRAQIEQVRADEELTRMPETAWFAERVAALDARFRAQLQPHRLARREGTPWWESHPPRRGGAQLSKDFRSVFDVELETTADA